MSRSSRAVFIYGDTCGGCLVEDFPPDEINYVFSGGTGSITGLGVTTTGVESSVAISNDQEVDTDAAALFAIFGLTVMEGTTSDVWSVASETSDDVIEWDVSFVYLATDPFSDSSYTATPPPNPDLIIFQLDEDDEVKYFAFGEVTTVVPIPASVWLFGSGLLGLIGMASRKKACTVTTISNGGDLWVAVFVCAECRVLAVSGSTEISATTVAGIC